MKEQGGPIPNQALAMILQVLRRNRNRNILGALLLAAVAGVWLGWHLGLTESLWTGGNLLLAGITIAAVGYAGMERLRHDTNRDDFCQMLEKSPGSLVWVYYLRIDIQPFGVHVRQTTTLFFWTNEHSHLALRATEKESIAIMNALRACAPHASFGYSLQKEQLYRADPALLRR